MTVEKKFLIKEAVAMIEGRELTKTCPARGNPVFAVDKVTLTVRGKILLLLTFSGNSVGSQKILSP